MPDRATRGCDAGNERREVFFREVRGSRLAAELACVLAAREPVPKRRVPRRRQGGAVGGAVGEGAGSGAAGDDAAEDGAVDSVIDAVSSLA